MRRYSDDDLTRAMATATSWRGVLRGLGLHATSSAAIRSVRGHADRLGLSHAHFRGQRSWTDDQLIAAVPVCTSWSEVTSTLGLAGGSATTTLRGHELRLDLDVIHLNEPGGAPRYDRDLAPTTTHLSRAGSLLAAAWFELSGISVSWPLEPSRYDLLVWWHDRAARIQVKTTRVRAGSSWCAQLATTRKEVHTYSPDDIDEFFIIDGDLNYYLIPLRVVGGLKSVSLASYQPYLLTKP